MMFLADTNSTQFPTVADEMGIDAADVGQLITPLTRFRNYGTRFAIDNGAYAGFNPAVRRMTTRTAGAGPDRTGTRPAGRGGSADVPA
jgi:hypothetical protein